MRIAESKLAGISGAPVSWYGSDRVDFTGIKRSLFTNEPKIFHLYRPGILPQSALDGEQARAVSLGGCLAFVFPPLPLVLACTPANAAPVVRREDRTRCAGDAVREDLGAVEPDAR